MDQYRPLDISRREIRLLSFDNTTEHSQVRLHLHYVSLNDWKPEYVSFRDQNTSMSSSQLSNTWNDRLEITVAMPRREIYENVKRFIWGDYICLSYTWGDCAGQKATIFLNGVSIAVNKHLEAALRDLKSSFECQLGMKVWVDALCINHADVVDKNAHVLRVKDVFSGAFSVTIWTKDHEDLDFTGLHQPGEQLILCDIVLTQYGKRALEELLGVRNRHWGAAEDEDEKLKELVQEVDYLVFDQYDWTDSDDEDELGLVTPHFRDAVYIELVMLFRKEYWSRLWIIQELAVSPITSTVHWVGSTTFQLSTLQTVCEILLTYPGEDSDSEKWRTLKPKLDLLAFITTWRTLEIAPGDTEPSLNNSSIRELNLLAQRANCSLPHDRVYGIMGLFPLSVSSAVTIDYSREAADVVTEFSFAVPGWMHHQS